VLGGKLKKKAGIDAETRSSRRLAAGPQRLHSEGRVRKDTRQRGSAGRAGRGRADQKTAHSVPGRRRGLDPAMIMKKVELSYLLPLLGPPRRGPGSPALPARKWRRGKPFPGNSPAGKPPEAAPGRPSSKLDR